MTEITAKIKWIQLAVAVLLAPFMVNAMFILVSAFFPPSILLVLPAAWCSLILGYASYLILGGPLMVLAFVFGFDHPLFHGLIGYGAVSLIPGASALGIPYMPEPELANIGHWFGPLWCAMAAAVYRPLSREYPCIEGPAQ